MSNCVKKATTTILLKLASSDGEINVDELDIIEKFADDQPADELFSNAIQMDVPEIVEDITKPEDRFFIRLKAQFMVASDGEVTEHEKALIKKLQKALPLSDEQEKLLLTAIAYEKEEGETLDSPEFKEMYANSSFTA